MTPPTPDLARRAVACRGWRWMPGMVCCLRTIHFGLAKCRLLDDDVDDPRCYDGCLPDLSDPATLGCLLALVREAWGDPHAYLAPGDGWFVGRGARDGIVGEGATEAEALVAALEAAPAAGGAR